MAKQKEIPLIWTRSCNEALGAQVYFVNANRTDKLVVTLYANPDLKVLAAKKWIKSYMPEFIENWLGEHPGWIQCDSSTYESTKKTL